MGTSDPAELALERQESHPDSAGGYDSLDVAGGSVLPLHAEIDVRARGHIGTWLRVVAALWVVVLAAVWWISLQAPAVGVFHDDAILITSARGLADGDGFRVLSLPDEIAQTKYPIAFPALLAVVWKLVPDFPGNIPYLKMVPLVFALLWFGVTYLYVREETRQPAMAATLVMLVAGSPWVVFLGTTVLSETMFAFFLTVSLYLLRRIERNGKNRSWSLVTLAALSSAVTYLVRAAALPLAVAAVVVLSVRNGLRPALVYIMIFAVAITPWVFWQSSNIRSDGVHSYYSAQAYKEWNLLSSFSLPEKVHVAARNILLQLVWPTDHLGIPRGMVGFLACLTIAGLALVGLVMYRRNEAPVTYLFLAGYLGMLVLWPWPPARFISPVLPLLLLPSAQGLDCVVHRFCPKNSARIVTRAIVLVLLVACAYLTNFRVAHQTIRLGAAHPSPYAYIDWHEAESMYRWIDENLPGDAIVIDVLDPALHLHTGRKATRSYSNASRLYYFEDGETALGDAHEFVARIDELGATHVVCVPNSLFAESEVLETLVDEVNRSRPNLFRLLRTEPGRSYRVFAVDRALLSGLSRTGM